MSVQDNMVIVRKYYDSFNNRTLDEGAKLFAENAEIINPAFNINLKGPEGYKQSSNIWLKAFPDGKIKISTIIPGEDFVTVEFTGNGNNTGILNTPQGEIKATRKQAKLLFCEVLNIKDGKITRSAIYFDFASLLRQLGVLAEVKH